MIQIPIIKAVCQVVPDKKICYVYKISRCLLDDATYLISRLKWFQTIFFHVSHFKKASENGQKIPQSHSADQPTAYVKHVNPEAGQFLAPWA